MHILGDTKTDFTHFIKARNKTTQRRILAEFALPWLRLQRRRGAKGAVMFDIDDTIINGNEHVTNGFEFMKMLYDEVARMFPIHIVTARPDCEHDNVIDILLNKGFCISTDRLHMLPTHLYENGSSRDIEKFKWNASQMIFKAHHGIVARFGDKLWDVAHIDSLHGYMGHITDHDCCVFLDPKLKGTLSVKLPRGGK